VTLLLHPAGVHLLDQAAPGFNRISGRIEDVLFKGETYRVRVCPAEGVSLEFSLPNPPASGSAVMLEIPQERIICLPDRGDLGSAS
jgi:hypothetical protein